MVTELAIMFLGLMFAVIGYLLKRRDDSQGEQIKDLRTKCDDLYDKHNDDVKRLFELELHIARNHYQKDELDKRVLELNNTFIAVGEKLERKLDELNRNFSTHLMNHTHKGDQ